MNQISAVTVVVVGYNHAEYIETCLDSVFAQTSRPAQVIVMDDASPDRTSERAREWSLRTGHPIDVRTNAENVGLCATLNAALRTITTPYYAYISADDHMEPTRLAEQVAVMDQAPSSCAAVYSDAYIEDGSGTRTGELASQHFAWPQLLSGSNELYDQMLYHSWIPAPSVLLRTATVKAVGGYDPDLYFEDLDLWLRLLRSGHSFGCVPKPLVTFRVHPESLGSTTFDHKNLRFVRAMRIILHKHVVDGEGQRQMKLQGRLWWLALRSATGGDFDREVLRDLIAFRDESGISHPLRASVRALARGIAAAGRKRAPWPSNRG